MPKSSLVRCHPEKPRYRRGLCGSCYYKERETEKPPSVCHPDRNERSNGFCRLCYQNQLNLKQRANKRGITVERLQELFLFQEDKCWICSNPRGKKDLGIDHDHTSGEVRGLLCSSCNRGLGLFHDDPNLLSRAIQYLRESQERIA